MFQPTKKMLYAIEAVLDIAFHAGGEPVQSREITRRQGIPRRYLEQTLQQLVRDGILVGVRGPRGGYRLARERRRVSIGDIVRVVEDMDNLDADDSVSPLGIDIIRPMCEEIHEETMARLDEITIDDLCRRAHDKNIPSEAQEFMDFTI
jgi:Rrf2 family protein